MHLTLSVKILSETSRSEGGSGSCCPSIGDFISPITPINVIDASQLALNSLSSSTHKRTNGESEGSFVAFRQFKHIGVMRQELRQWLFLSQPSGDSTTISSAKYELDWKL